MGVNVAPSFPVTAIVLAAGGSTRMGRPKQLLTVDGQPMVRRVAEAVCEAGLGQVVIVVGAHAESVSRALAGLPVDIVRNEAWAEGMSSSVRAGLRAVRPESQAALLVLADQPRLTPNVIRALVVRYQVTGAHIVAPFYRGQRGNPVLFDRALFAELLQVKGDQGGRLLLARHQEQLERVEIEDPAVLMDIDTLQEYTRIEGSENDKSLD